MRCFIALPLPGPAREALARCLIPLRELWPRLAWTAPAGWHISLAFLGEVDERGLGCALRAIEAAAAPGGAVTVLTAAPGGAVTVLTAAPGGAATVPTVPLAPGCAAAPECTAAAPEPPASRFDFSFSKLDFLPPRGSPRLLYAGLAELPAGASAAVWRRVNEELAREALLAGLPPLNAEWGPLGRPFIAHLSLARARPGVPFPRRADLGGPEPTTRDGPEPTMRVGLPEGSWTIDRCVVYKSDLRPGGSVYTELGSVELPKPRPQAPEPVPRV